MEPATELSEMEPPVMTGLYSLTVGDDGKDNPLLRGGSRRPRLERQQEGGCGRRGFVAASGPQGTR